MGVVYGIQTSNKNDDIRGACGDVKRCPESSAPAVKSLQDDAKSSGTLATVGFIVGGVGVAAGITLLAIGSGAGDGSAGDRGTGARVSAWVGPGSVGLNGEF
jgi:hypothetical protein